MATVGQLVWSLNALLFGSLHLLQLRIDGVKVIILVLLNDLEDL